MSIFVTLHRYAALAVGIFWLLQALAGIILVFRWELDDAAVAGTRHPVEIASIEQRIDVLEAENTGWTAASLWTSATDRNRFDIALAEPSTQVERVWRVDGHGTILRATDTAMPLRPGTFYDTITKFHTSLFLGDAGALIIGVSGLILCINILLGLKIAWVAKGQWRQSLSIATKGNLRRKLWQWHRTFGLWLALPALVLLTSGTALTQSDAIAELLDVQSGPPTVASQNGDPKNDDINQVRLSNVVISALFRFPAATLSGVIFPTRDKPWFEIRLRQQDEPGRKFGKTTVYIDAGTGRQIVATDAVRSPLANRFVNFLYPLHTGQAFLTFGRAAALLIGLWLVAMILLGWTMFARRNRSKAEPRPSVAPFSDERNIQ
jgi:uncharacterized iron-regulated membrane protein